MSYFDTASRDIFSPTRLSPSFSPFSDLGAPLSTATVSREVEPPELNVDEVSKYGLTSAFCAQNMIPRYSPLLLHRTSSSNMKTTPPKKTTPLKLFISARYKRAFASSKQNTSKYAGSETKYPTSLPSFQFTSSDSSESDASSDENEDEEADLYDKTPRASPRNKDRTPTATPVKLKADLAEEQGIKVLLYSVSK